MTTYTIPAPIQQVIDTTIGKEGRYSNDSHDPGGETIWGITVGVAREEGYTGPMKDMPRATACQIYYSRFFLKPHFDLVYSVSPKVAEELFDTGVNMGPTYPQLWYQQWLNVFNNEGKDYADIVEDGQIGSKTIAAHKGLIAKRGQTAADDVMLKGLNADQACRYKDIARSRTANERYEFGWIANRVGF